MRVFSLIAIAIGLTLTPHLLAQPGRATARGGQTRAAPQNPGGSRAARQEMRVPFTVGETLTFDVSWSGYLVAGTATSRVVEKRPAARSSAYYIVAEGRPLPLIARLYALYYKMDSLVDSYTALSHRTSLYVEEGSRRRTSTTVFDRNTRRAQIEVRDDATHKDDFAVPQNVQDGLATLYAIRGRTLRAGDRISVPVADDGSLYTANFEVLAPELVSVPMGRVNAWNLRITILDARQQPVGSNIGAWITTDARRLPAKLQADLPVGSFALALRSAEQQAD